MAHTKVTKTYSQNTGTANTFSYSGSFNVFKATEVEVELDNIALTYTASTINESASPREYTVDATAKTIHIGGADLSSGTVVIQPVTDMGAPTPRATYAPGSSITSEDLNNNQLQLMRKAMEYDEQKLSSRGGTMTGDLTMGEDQTIIFEGATDDGYETTLTVTDPTADRTITLPNVTGTVVTTGDTATVTATMLAANSVDSSELVDGSIDTSHISSSAVTTGKIAADAVTGAKIADDAINSEHYTDGSIDTAHIADSQITTAKIAADAITAAKIADDVVNSEHYAAGSIDTEHIADLNVTTAKIAADAITGAKIADDAIDSEHYTDGSIDAAHLASSSVTTAKIAADAVTGAKIADDAIDSEHYTDGSIDTAHIADSQVTTAKIAGDAITGAKIADDAVDSEHLAADSIDAEHYASASVDSTALASNAVTTAKITDANVTTAKLAADSVTIAKIGCEQTTISDSDSHIPTSGAVVDYVAAQIAPIGGLEVIADEDNFPTTQPSAGVVISIADAGGVVFNGSGVSTTARTAGNGSDNVTINGAPSSLYGETLAAGVGMQVSSTGSSHTYNYHKILATESDVKQLSDDINDFNSRYRINAGEPSSNNDDGDLVWDTSADKMKVYDGTASAWKEVTSSGDFKFLVAVDAGTTTAATYDGSDTSFDLKETTNSGSAASVTNINQLIVSLNGVIQKPNTGSYSASEEGFYLTDSDTIRFCTAPPSGSTSFIIQCGSAVSIPTPGDGTVSAAKIASGAVTTAKIADANVTTAKIADDAITAAKIGAIAGDMTWDSATNAGRDMKWDDSESDLTFNDAAYIQMGDQDDMTIGHNGTHSFVQTVNAPLKLGPSGSYACELLYGNTSVLKTTGTGAIVLGPEGTACSIEMHADDGDDNEDKYELKVDTSGVFTISNYADGAWEKAIECNHGGNVELYYDNTKRFETTSAGVQVTGTSLHSDNIKIQSDTGHLFVGADDDLDIKHTGSHGSIINSTGNLNITNTGSNTIINADNITFQSGDQGETIARFLDDGACELWYDNTKRFETNSSGAHCTGSLTADTVAVQDSEKFLAGNNDDLQIYHDGSNSYIKDNSNTLFIRANAAIKFENDDGSETMAKFHENGDCELYYDNAEKLATTTNGVTVTGSVLTANTAKCWIKLNMSSGSALDSFNVSSVSDEGTGTFDVNFSATITNEHAAAVASVSTSALHAQIVYGSSDGNGFQFRCLDGGGSLADDPNCSLVIFDN